jgi:hypothetical protein
MGSMHQGEAKVNGQQVNGLLFGVGDGWWYCIVLYCIIDKLS